MGEVKQINIKNRTWSIRRHDQYQKFWCKVVKN